MPDAEPPLGAIASKLNWLRAGVLGANDGIVSTAALIFGVAGAAASHQTVMLAGIAAVSAGALSMAVGEYVSVSSQRDLEAAELAQERAELAADPEHELEELRVLLEARGSSVTSRPKSPRKYRPRTRSPPMRGSSSASTPMR